MIDRKNAIYVTLYINHNIPSTVQWDPKVSMLLWLTATAQSERHTKSNASVVVQERFFQVVDWKTHRHANTSSGSKTKIF